jgi:hypothetical protein
MDVELELNKHGASVIYFPYTKNVSSSLLKKVLEKIYNDQ